MVTRAVTRNTKNKGTPAKTEKKSIPINLWLAFLLLVVVNSVAAIGVVFSTHSSRVLVNELQQLEKERNELQVEWGQLLLEQSSLVSQGRIEEMAMTDLGMKVPDLETVVIVHHD